MKNLTLLQIAGIALLLISPLTGLCGAAWSINQSFDSLAANESAGIGAVGNWITTALIYTFGGIIGALAGGSLILFGRNKATKS